MIYVWEEIVKSSFQYKALIKKMGLSIFDILILHTHTYTHKFMHVFFEEKKWYIQGGKEENYVLSIK